MTAHKRKKSLVEERNRAEIIIDMLKSGGFTEDELNEIIDVCGEEIAKKT